MVQQFGNIFRCESTYGWAVFLIQRKGAMVKCSRLLHLLCKVLTPFINVRNKINNYGKAQIISSHCNLLTQIKMTNIV